MNRDDTDIWPSFYIIKEISSIVTKKVCGVLKKYRYLGREIEIDRFHVSW